jgi:hypothetical protein
MHRVASLGRGEGSTRAIDWIESKGIFRAPEAWIPPNSAGVRTSRRITFGVDAKSTGTFDGGIVDSSLTIFIL